MNQKVKCIAGGDIFITRRIPRGGYEGYDALQSLICESEVRYANLEILFHERSEGCYPGYCTGTYAMCTPDAIEDVKNMGFNIFSSANNHSMDYSHSGLEAHLKHLRRHNVLHSGTGLNLEEASAPIYFESKAYRIALVSACSTFDKTWAAGIQGRNQVGRPGLNPLGFEKICYITNEQMRMLEEIARQTAIDGSYEQAVKEGFAVPVKDGFCFNGQTFRVDNQNPRTETNVVKRDADRIIATIREAKKQADFVMVSLHSHEPEGRDMTAPAKFLQDFSRRCIDEGASIMLGHGPHQVRGVELYNGGVILYSLGNLLFENDTVEVLPPDFYIKYGLPLDSSVSDGPDYYIRYEKHSGSEKAGFTSNPFMSAMASWEFDADGISEIKLYPIDLGFDLPRYRRGVPTLSKDMEIIRYMDRLSAPFGTTIEITPDCGVIRVKK